MVSNSVNRDNWENGDVSNLDMGGITIEDHPIHPADRRALICKPIVIKQYSFAS